jgi:hypothetical protein
MSSRERHGAQNSAGAERRRGAPGGVEDGSGLTPESWVSTIRLDIRSVRERRRKSAREWGERRQIDLEREVARESVRRVNTDISIDISVCSFSSACAYGGACDHTSSIPLPSPCEPLACKPAQSNMAVSQVGTALVFCESKARFRSLACCRYIGSAAQSILIPEPLGLWSKRDWKGGP